MTAQACDLPLTVAAEEIEARRLSPVELIDSVLARIEKAEPKLNAFALVTADAARKAAEVAEHQIVSGRYRGALHGIPLGVKDLYDTAGVPTTCSSKVRADNVPESNAVMVDLLLDAGMVMVGKTHTHEFACGGFTPTTRNPWNTDRIPGGSSGGSAAAVAVGACMVGTGSDTAGSIRIPAAFCGTVGMKPTFGLVSKRGVAPLSWSLDHVGPLTRNVRDAALVLNAVAGFDRLDPTSVDVPVPDYTDGIEAGIAGLRVGIPTNFFFDHVHSDVVAATHQAIEVLGDLGADLREVTVPYTEEILAAEWAILLPEASAYHQEMLRARGDDYGEDIRVLFEVGEMILATDYIKAQRARTLMQRGWKDVFADLDVVVSPCMPTAAPAVGSNEVIFEDGTTELAGMMMVRLASAANLTGQPAISVPSGFDRDGLPVAIQILGRPFDEATVFRTARAYERATESVGLVAPI